MARVRPNTIQSAHGALGAAAEAWAEQDGQEVLRSYGFRHGVAHLLSCDQAQGAEALLTDFDYAMARLESENGPGAQPLAQDAGAVKETGDLMEPEAFRIWEDFLRTKAYLLVRADANWGAEKILLQLAVEHADDSPVTKAAEAWLEDGYCDWLWLRRARRPSTLKLTGVTTTIETGRKTRAGFILGGNRLVSVYFRPPCLEIWETEGCLSLNVVGGDGGNLIRGQLLLEANHLLTWSSPDLSRRSAPGTWENPIQIWDLDESSSAPRFLGEPHASVNGCAVVDSNRILSWCDQTARLWSVTDGACLGSTIEGDDELLGAMVLSDGRIAAWDWSCLKLWTIGQTSSCLTVEIDDYLLGAIQLSSGLLALWTDEHQLLLINGANGELVGELEGHEGFIGGIVELPGERLLSWAGDPGSYPELDGPFDGSLRIWSVAKQAELACIQTEHEQLKQVEVIGHDRVVILAQGEIQLWSLVSGERLGSLHGLQPGVTRFHVRGGQLLACARDGTLGLWSLEAFRGDVEQKSRRQWIDGDLLDDGRQAFIENGAAWLWDSVEGRTVGSFGGNKSADPQWWPGDLERLPGGALLACKQGRVIEGDGRHGRLWLLNAADGTPGEIIAKKSQRYQVLGDEHLLVGHRLKSDEIWSLSPVALKLRLDEGVGSVMGGRTLAWRRESQVDVFNDQLEPAYRVQDVVGTIELPSGVIVAELSRQGTRQLAVCQEQEPIYLEGAAEGLHSAVLPELGLLCTAHDDGSLRVWSLEQRKRLLRFEHGHSHLLTVQVVGKSGLLSCGFGSAKLWDRNTGRCTAQFTGHGESVSGFCLAGPDELMSWSPKADELFVWDLASGVRKLATGYSDAASAYPARMVLIAQAQSDPRPRVMRLERRPGRVGMGNKRHQHWGPGILRSGSMQSYSTGKLVVATDCNWARHAIWHGGAFLRQIDGLGTIVATGQTLRLMDGGQEAGTASGPGSPTTPGEDA